MGDQGMGKLTASLEDLSLKKQLPLRQQAQKPMLKYSNNAIKPVQLFNHADLMSIRSNAEAARNAYSSLSNASTSSTMSTPFRSSVKPAPSPQMLLQQATGTNGQPSNSASSGTLKTSPSKGHSNPYARPLSAKDIVSDLQNQQKIKKTPSSTQAQPGPNSMYTNGGSGTPMFGFPMNAFMRPQSALRKENSAQSTKSTTESKNSINSQNSSAKSSSANEGSSNKTGSKVTPRKTIPPTRLEREPDLSQTGLPNSNSSTQTVKNQFGPAKAYSVISEKAKISAEKTSAANSTSSPSKVTAASQTPNSAIAKMNESSNSESVKKVLNSEGNSNTQSKPIVYARPVSSLPRPGSGASSSKSGTPDSQTKVRNPSYTPTKPYHEVSNPANVSSKPPISAVTKVQQTTETVITVKADPPKGNTYMAPTNIKKMNDAKQSASNQSSGSSKESSASSGTVYYRKESKADTIIHEQRPPAIGAPSKPPRGAEKGSRTTLTSGSELDEAADDESEVPSGERMPGDGEASVEGGDDDDEFDDYDDEDMVDDLDDDCIGGSDGESDGYSFTSSSLSRRSSSAHRLKTRAFSATGSEIGSVSRPQTASPDRSVKPPLIHSHFPNIPPVVAFVADGEKVEQLPWDYRKFLKWRLSPITPNVVKHCLARSGFRITKRNHDWLGCWGKHMKSPGFKALREYQKLNHFPGSFQIGRKDRLWRNLSKMQVHFGKKEFGFFPQTYCLPMDAKLMKRAFEDGGTKQKWIIKPPASARGIGIKVINKITQVPKKRPVIVQKYLGRPYLINDSKFDLRIYVYVSSMDPLRLYVFEDGLTRFASMKYSGSMKHLANKFMHLTNYSVNKKNTDYQANSDDTVCQGHKWSLKALWNYMKRQGVNTSAVWENMKDLIIKTIICSDGPVNSLIKANCKSRYCVHELFGFDILLDESLKPWILEVNISPSLHSNSQLDINIKGHMIKDLMNISGIRVPDKHDLVQHPPQTSGPPDLSMYVPPNNVCMDKRLFSQQLSPDERAKHAYYSQRHQDEQIQQTILDILTPDDIRFLTESIDEDGRKGGFQRVFPTPTTHKYLKYFETPRYYNLLLDQWVQRFNRMEQRGIALLQSYCEDGIHLEINTDSPNHQWNPPSATCHTYRENRLLSAPVSKHKENDLLKTSSSSSNLLKTQKRTVSKPVPQRSASQSSGTSSINNLVFSPQPPDILSPKGKAPSRMILEESNIAFERERSR
ncbi:tubulin monoglutamylase TTLL4-like isoform X3 [Mercenaria mercenaria]|uniref:tubulin monoglutamylase TTLL4-like isoform X3 n=1 Tax=Mercenaria mercenaria TaxID=6596 RepID=UPI00234E427F|nr:tubulin monoglutamylase TTLL4-like isoform X3 [Mercenaria mercenaria]